MSAANLMIRATSPAVAQNAEIEAIARIAGI